MTDAITTLRAMYRNVRDGQALDVQAYILALLAVAADGGDVWRITRAFEAFGYWTRLDILGMCEGAADRVREAKAARGWKGAIKVASLLGMSEVWNQAMNAYFGPTNTHESRRGSDGVPTLETLAEFPEIGERMAMAAERFETLLAWYDRHNAGQTSYLGQVVEYRKPAQVAA